MEVMGEEIRSNGLETVGGTDEYEYLKDYLKYEDIKNLKFDEEVGAVLTGIDFAVTYTKIAMASFYIQKGCPWIVTNDDAFTM